MALFISIGNVGGIIGSNIFLANEAPHYWTGYGFSLAITVCAILATIGLRKSYQIANKHRDSTSDTQIEENYSAEELVKLGDRSPRYRYVL
jgi:ABC-type transport system involved in cytochrome bd biosynthesis fused ATPase/permease subunit